MIKKILVRTVAIGFVLLTVGCSIAETKIERGVVSRIVFEDWAGPAIPAWVYLPEAADLRDAPVLVLMHGAKRAPDRYLREWQSLANEHGIVVIAPEFSTQDFPSSRGYNLGNVFDKESNTLKDESLWSFSAIEPLFDHVVAEIGSQQTHYAMFGHSAGSQFAHRFMYYKPNARANLFLLANAGWYTLPDINTEYPYGLKGAATSADTLAAAFGKNVVVLLGDQDNNPSHSSLRRTPEAMAQGAHRYARGFTFFDVAKSNAQRLGTAFAWRIQSVPGVAHSNGGMAQAAAPIVIEER